MKLPLTFSNLSQSSLLRSVATYGFFTLFNKVLPFLLLPVMTRYLTPNDYGLVSLFGVATSCACIFTGCNMDKAYFKIYYESNKYKHQDYLGTAFLWVLASSSFLFFAISLLKDTFPVFESIPTVWISFIPWIAMMNVVMLLVQTAWQLRNKAFTYGFFQFGRTTTELFIALLLIVCLDLGWRGRISAQIAAGTFFSIIGLRLLHKKEYISFTLNKQYLRHGLRYGVPLIPHYLAGLLTVSIDKLFIGGMIGVLDVGIYAVGDQLASMINLLVTSFDQAYHPWLFRKLSIGSQESKNIIVKATYIYFAAISITTLLFSLLLPIALIRFIGVRFHGAFEYVFWISLGYAFLGMYYMVAKYLFFTEKTHLLSTITLSSIPLNIVLNYIFIKWNGALGATQATALTHFLVFFITWYAAAKAHSMPWITFFKKTERIFDTKQ